ncbi:MAG: hypothetical protein A2X81_03515 [Desulfobacterales bacterium GWB2_56_26]|nr:MAG: hypothetical protein A2X81_03515 [Desulfobacterales bacterium GWB2_56_26]
MKKILRLFLAFGLLCLVLLGLLLGTELGLGLIQTQVGRLTDGRVTVGKTHGRLLGDWDIAGLRIGIPGMDVEVEEVKWNWRPVRLGRGEFHVAGLTVRGVKLYLKEKEPEPHAAGPMKMPKILLPFALAVEKFAVEGLQLFGSDGDRLMVIDKIGGQLAGHDESLAVTDFFLDAPGIGFSMHGDMDLGRNWHLDLLGRWWLSDYGFHPIDGTFSLFGPLNAPKVTFAVNSSGGIQVQGQVQNLLQSPEWTATVTAWHTDLSVLIEDCPEIKLKSFLGKVSGDIEGYRGHATAQGDWGKQRDMQLNAQLTADWMGIAFDALRIDSGESSAVAEGGRISWRKIFDWQGKFHFVDFDPSVFTEALQGEVTADFSSRGDVREDIPDDYGVDISFDIERLEGHLHGEPIAASGNLQLTENDLRTDGLILKSGQVEGVAHVDKGMISWDDQVIWDGEIRLKNFNPEGLFPDFPGRINGEFSGRGSFTDSGPEGFVKIHGISGRLRDQELAGEGEIRLVGETLRTKGLFLRSGASELVVEGQAGDDFALDFTFSSPNIGTLLPDSEGTVKVQGSLRGSPQEPLVDADLTGSAFRYGDYSFARLQAEMQAGFWPEGGLKGFIAGTKMKISGMPLDQGRIDFSGTMQAQEISAAVSGDAGQLKVRAKAAHRDDWTGEVAGFQLNSTYYGTWRQQRNASFTAASDTFSLEKLCITDDHSNICAGGELQLTDILRWQAEGSLDAVSIDWLNRLKLMKSPIDGMISAEFTAAGDSRRISSATAAVSLPETAVALALEDEEFSAVHFQDTRLSLNIADSRLQAEFSTGMKNGSRVQATADVPGAGDFDATLPALPLAGRLELANFDLAVLSAVTGYGVEPTGRVNSSFVLGGTLGKPVLTGDGKIEGGGIALPYQGIMLENITASIEAGENAAKIACRATSGPGELKADGILRYGDSGVEGVLQVRGKNFLLVNLPEYTFRVTPDVLFRFSGNKGDVSGVVKVPYGMITPEEMTDAVKTSEDVILVNGRKEIKEDGWPFALDLDVQVGDDVRIDGYGLAGRLTGQLNIKTGRDELLTGKGELDLVEGKFSLYGRTFDIERGRVLFTGGPIENPGVDIRAQKKVGEEEAKDKAYTVGVDISGLVQDLQYHLFSDPYMDDTEILSMMIVGHSLADSSEEDSSLIEAAATTLGLKGSTNFMQGIGSVLHLDDLHLEGSSTKENVSLVVGKRVTKDLYIGYDINMFNQLGEFRVRYNLDRGFSIETRSSSESTGADFLYSFEK